MRDLPLIRIDATAHRAWIGDREIPTTPTTWQLLITLARHAGQARTFEQIIADVWAAPWPGAGKTLGMHVSALRRAIGDLTADPLYVTSIRGIGYRLEAAVLDAASVLYCQASGDVAETVAALSARLAVVERQLADLTALVAGERQHALGEAR